LSIATLVTRGFGSFGTIGDVVTAGYTVGPAGTDCPTASQNAIAVWNETLENGLSAADMMRLMLSVLTGKVSGLPGEPIFLSNDGLKTRVRMITDENGNRLKVIVLDGS